MLHWSSSPLPGQDRSRKLLGALPRHDIEGADYNAMADVLRGFLRWWPGHELWVKMLHHTKLMRRSCRTIARFCAQTARRREALMEVNSCRFWWLGSAGGFLILGGRGRHPAPLPDRGRVGSDVPCAMWVDGTRHPSPKSPPPLSSPPPNIQQRRLCGDLKATFDAGLVCVARAARQNNL